MSAMLISYRLFISELLGDEPPPLLFSDSPRMLKYVIIILNTKLIFNPLNIFICLSILLSQWLCNCFMLLLWLQLKVDEAKEIVTDQWKDLEEAEAEEEAFEDSDQDGELSDSDGSSTSEE